VNARKLRRIAEAAVYLGIALYLTWRLLVGVRIHAESLRPPAPTLRLADGTSWPLFAARNAYTVLDFGASWCPPCRLEEPLIASFSHRHPELRLRFVDEQESASTALHFAASYGLETPALDDGALASRLGVNGFPTVIVLRRDGSVAAQFTGFDPGIELALLPYAKDKAR